MNMRYNLKYRDERYDYVSEIGYMPNYEYEVTDEPFDMETAYLYRYDKSVGQWVEGEIDEDGNWQPKE